MPQCSNIASARTVSRTYSVREVATAMESLAKPSCSGNLSFWDLAKDGNVTLTLAYELHTCRILAILFFHTTAAAPACREKHVLGRNHVNFLDEDSKERM